MKKLGFYMFFMALNLQFNVNSFSQESKDEVQLFLSNYYSTMSDREWKVYETFFLEKATLTTIWQDEKDESPSLYSHTIDEFLAQTADGPDSQPIFEEKMLSSEIKINGNLANAWVHYAAKFGTDENLMQWEGTDHFSLIKFEERWYIVSLSYEPLEH